MNAAEQKIAERNAARPRSTITDDDVRRFVRIVSGWPPDFPLDAAFIHHNSTCRDVRLALEAHEAARGSVLGGQRV